MAEKTCTYDEFEKAWDSLQQQVTFKLVSYKIEPLSVTITEEPRFTRRHSGRAVVNWAGCSSHTPEEARVFAIALDEIADLAERFKYNGYKIGD